MPKKASKKSKKTESDIIFPTLPQKLYETLRWLTWIVIPAGATLFSLICITWSLNLPLDMILTTITGVETFIGTILGLSKYNTDKVNI